MAASTYKRHRGVYDAWKKRILEEASVGHRYYCLEHLCALAVQCNIDEKELLSDIDEVAEYFDTLTVSEENEFTQNDVLSALSTYKNPSIGTYRRKLEYISDRTQIKLTRNKRNGRTRKAHLRRARAILSVAREELLEEGKFEAVGRPSKKALIHEWQDKNPNGRKIDCERDTGISRPTILKHWKS